VNYLKPVAIGRNGWEGLYVPAAVAAGVPTPVEDLTVGALMAPIGCARPQTNPFACTSARPRRSRLLTPAAREIAVYGRWPPWCCDRVGVRAKRTLKHTFAIWLPSLAERPHGP